MKYNTSKIIFYSLPLLLLAVVATARFTGFLPMSADAQQTQQTHYEQKNPDGSWKWTNSLADESSPYLLQHAHNPVHWYPWGKKAFDEARRTGKPIFLSIGYSTCYWCHVMERQSFENPALAAILNEHFISIKVDREERPDVDDIYMAAVQLITGSGGWPMSVFLTPPGAQGADDPGLRPFYAGTYFPPDDAYGRPGFGTLLTSIANAWKTKKQEVIQQAQRVGDAVRQQLTRAQTPGVLSEQVITKANDQLMGMYDSTEGGFGSAPKFPQPSNLLFLLAAQKQQPDPQRAKALSYTLERMAMGGMYDQVGGGFHRYSTDGKWLVPHFEKMLYDNGQLAEVYSLAQEQMPLADDPDGFDRIARGICDYVLRQMRDPTGTFWSAQDAEVDAREGLNYLWMPDEVSKAIDDPQLAALAIRMYSLDEKPNFQDPHHASEPARYILFLKKSLAQFAAEQKIPLDVLIQRKKQIDIQLLKVRQTRKPPRTDDKVLTSWNGLMIAGLAQTGRVSNETRYLDAARQAATYILEHMRTDAGSLYHAMRRGKAKIPGFLEDYAYFVHGLVELYRADHEQKWLTAARSLHEYAREHFKTSQGGYFDTLEGQSDLFVRTQSTYDGATPSPNSQMVHNALDLWELTGEKTYRDQAQTDLKAASSSMQASAVGVIHMIHACMRFFATQNKEQSPTTMAVPTESAATLPPAIGASTPKSSALAESQPRSSHIHVSVEPTTLKARKNHPVSLVLTLKIDPPYHLNAHQPGNKTVIPTTVQLEDATGIDLKVDYPTGKKHTFPFGDQPLFIYQGQVRIPMTLTWRNGTADTPKLMLRYQVCTDDRCLSPRTVVLPIRIMLDH